MRSALPLVLIAFAATTTATHAQTQIKPRVMLIVDTSGSMLERVDNGNNSGGDGTYEYFDPSLAEPITIYRGRGGASCGGTCCLPDATSGQGDESRMAHAKRAIANAINGAGQLDWGLMRFQASTTCNVVNTLSDNDGTCTHDLACDPDHFCVRAAGQTQKRCWRIDNLCVRSSSAAPYQRGGGTGQCSGVDSRLRVSYSGSCGSDNSAGSAVCRTLQACNTDADCSGTRAGRCAPIGAGPAKACQCDLPQTSCPTGYSCDTSQDRCVYDEACERNSGNILVDPFGPGYSPNNVLPWVDGREIYGAGGTVVNPELRAQGSTPLGGAMREAIAWYNSNIQSDPQHLCRPYVAVLLTDGEDTCEPSSSRGPVAAVQGFISSTIENARVPNKVYVIGLNVTSNVLDNMAKAGGTGQARYAANQEDIQAALAEIVESSVLVEKCNGQDDNCNNICDEGFPDVALPAGCGGPKPDGSRDANTCNNGALPGTKCFRTGTYVCSADQLSQVCSAPTCDPMNPDPNLCPTVEVCNGIDDDCNGVIDDKDTPFVAGSGCGVTCPACNPTGVPQPETCNGCDDDCDGIADNNLIDVPLGCGTDAGECTPGTTYCCQQANPTVATCTRDPVTESASHTNTNALHCLGGQGPVTEICDTLDNNCNGQTDEVTQVCYPFSSGTPGQGICRSGVQQCISGMFQGACAGAVGPQPDVCDGIDNDCNGTPDSPLADSWAGEPCCPTGNLADCMGAAPCAMGTFQCVGGQRVCVGGKAKSPEVCDGIDNDCSGTADDNIPGAGAACTTSTGTPINIKGECRAQLACTGTFNPMGPNGLSCVQTVGPMPEICNLKDDDCNDLIDDNVTNATDPRVGVPGGSPCMPLVPPADKPPCDPGITVCRSGQIVCEGAVGPQPNLCDGISRDCTGVPNTSGNCPTGYECFQGNCVPQCGSGEFPCPGGFVCQESTMLCIPDECLKLNCPKGQLCHVDEMGKATCVDPCAMVTCNAGFACKDGVCVEDSCRSFGCPEGEVCVGNPPMCQADPCHGVTCPDGFYCNATGECVMVCGGPCPPGETCIDGMCQMNPCANMNCPAGQTCAIVSGQPMCVEDMCGAGCAAGQACCRGACTTDPCSLVSCPGGTHCAVEPSTCSTVCQPDVPPEEILGAGGGGVACSVAPPGTRGGGGAALLLLLVAFALAGRRGARR